LLFTRDGRDLIVCDDPTCEAVVEVAKAEDAGWVIASLAGPHYCPVGAAAQFRALLTRAFGAPPS
jgi:hypothetical protein